MRRHLGSGLMLSLLLAALLQVAGTGPAAGHPLLRPEEQCTVNRAGEEAVYNGTDPDRQLSAYSPFRVVNYPCARTTGARAILVEPGRIEMIEDGRLSRVVPFAVGSAPFSFERLARAVDDPGWIAEVEPGVFEVGAAVVQAPGTSMVVAAPAVTTLRLLDRPDVFVGGKGADARFEGVTVTSWNPDGGGPDLDLADGRPFVLYDVGGRLDVVSSQMSHLGSDRSGGAYGVAWRRVTGEVLDSTFDHNFFGVYTYEAADIVFRRNVFRDNLLYGFDPHDYSTRLVVEDNEAYGNGDHGFIVSRYVVDSVLRNNRAHDNGGSGIVLDFESNRNLVEGNLVEENGGDGIVILGSADNVVRNNTVRHNRVGIRINHIASQRNEIRDNLVVGNEQGLQAYGGAADLVIAGNRIYETGDRAMVLDAPRSSVRGGEIRGAAQGLVIETATSVEGLVITDVESGVRVSSTGIAELTDVRVDARTQALRVDGHGLVDVERSELSPLPDLAADGGGSSPGDAGWFPLVGVSAVVTAVVLEMLRWVRERRDKPSPAPAGVWNRA